MTTLRRLLDPALAFFAVAAIVLATAQLGRATAGVRIDTMQLGSTPLTVYRPAGDVRGPVVVIAHGFAGSQQLMQAFATTFARGGYTAVTFDFPGHGKNRTPLTGSITREDGATRTLVASLAEVAAFARGLGDGRLAVLGHSMASDIVVRFAEETSGVDATIAVSMFSPAVTADGPRNLLVVVGEEESTLKREALRAVGLATTAGSAALGVTYGDPSHGTGRRAAASAHAEHISVLYSRASMREALAWLDATFGVVRSAPPYLDARGGWLLLLFFGIALLARPIARFLPVVSVTPRGAGLRWRQVALPLGAPALLTPLVLRVLPTHFLPVLVADYLAVHFAVYGLFTFLVLRWSRSRAGAPAPAKISHAALAIGAAVVASYAVAVFGGAMDLFVTSFVPGPNRLLLVGAMLVGTLPYFLADEWLTRGRESARGAYPLSKAAFVISLGVAVALDFQRLLFLVIIIPVILVLFLIFGLLSRWVYRRTGHPFVAAIGNAVFFAWAIGVTFPLLAG